jgi:sugar phosphate isomerase/epimerase
MSLLKNADLDYKAITGALAAHGFDGYLCIEFVKDCVVSTPADFDLMHVLRNARRDYTFVQKAAARSNMVSF